jgi:hypothetical protein
MKSLKIILATLTLIVTASACSKSDDSPAATAPIIYPEENFFNGYLNITGFNQVSGSVNGGDFFSESLEFSALETGKINSFFFKVPNNLQSVTISIADGTTDTTIDTYGFVSGTYNVGSIQNIPTTSPIQLVKDKRYKIRLLSRSSYERKRTDDGNVTYPIVVGNIKLWNFTEKNITSGVTTPFASRYYGDFGFTFQRTQ